MRCARHPDIETNISCASCGGPICPDCMVYTSVGNKCPDCARMPKAALVRLKPDRLVIMIAVGLTASALGAVLFLVIAPWTSFFTLFLAYGLGYGIGEAVSWGSGRFHGRPVAIWAAACAALAILAPRLPGLLVAISSGHVGFIWLLLAAAIAAFAAWRRNE